MNTASPGAICWLGCMRIVAVWLAWPVLGCTQIVPTVSHTGYAGDLPLVLNGERSQVASTSTGTFMAQRNRSSIKLENIRYRNFSAPDQHQVQEDTIRAVKATPEKFIDAYRNDVRSFEGWYVNADLFKEVFAAYAVSRESRSRYNIPVHNAAAVLASALFVENLQATRESARTTVYFLTGSPGAGKTSMVLKTAALPRDAVMLFEGQMANFDVSRDKIQKVLDSGYKPKIIVVHARVEDAMDKTLQRFDEIGRGACIETISSIAGRLPDSLKQLANFFGQSLSLDIVDVRDRANPVQLRGFENVDILRSEGNYEFIKQRLQARVQQQRDAEKINEEAHRQAFGFPPRDCFELDSARHEKYQRDARE